MDSFRLLIEMFSPLHIAQYVLPVDVPNRDLLPQLPRSMLQLPFATLERLLRLPRSTLKVLLQLPPSTFEVLLKLPPSTFEVLLQLPPSTIEVLPQLSPWTFLLLDQLPPSTVEALLQLPLATFDVLEELPLSTLHELLRLPTSSLQPLLQLPPSTFRVLQQLPPSTFLQHLHLTLQLQHSPPPPPAETSTRLWPPPTTLYSPQSQSQPSLSHSTILPPTTCSTVRTTQREDWTMPLDLLTDDWTTPQDSLTLPAPTTSQPSPSIPMPAMHLHSPSMPPYTTQGPLRTPTHVGGSTWREDWTTPLAWDPIWRSHSLTLLDLPMPRPSPSTPVPATRLGSPSVPSYTTQGSSRTPTHVRGSPSSVLDDPESLKKALRGVARPAYVMLSVSSALLNIDAFNGNPTTRLPLMIAITTSFFAVVLHGLASLQLHVFESAHHIKRPLVLLVAFLAVSVFATVFALPAHSWSQSECGPHCWAERALVSAVVIGGFASLVIGVCRMRGRDGPLAARMDCSC